MRAELETVKKMFVDEQSRFIFEEKVKFNETLKGAAQSIRRHHPKLAICVYHKPEDMWEIPQYIRGLWDGYRLYLRHYGNNACDTVLYAV